MINVFEIMTLLETSASSSNTYSDFVEFIVFLMCVDMRFDFVIDIMFIGFQVWCGCVLVIVWFFLINKIVGGLSDVAAASRVNRTTMKFGDRSVGVGQCIEGVMYVLIVVFKFFELNMYFKVFMDNVLSC